VPPERNVRRPGISATGTSGLRYRGALVKNFVRQHSDLVIDPLRDAQPVKADKSVGDVIRRSRAIDQPCCRIQYNGLQVTYRTALNATDSVVTSNLDISEDMISTL